MSEYRDVFRIVQHHDNEMQCLITRVSIAEPETHGTDELHFRSAVSHEMLSDALGDLLPRILTYDAIKAAPKLLPATRQRVAASLRAIAQGLDPQ